MTPSEFAILREDIGKLFDKADDCAQTGARIETTLKGHKKYIEECYDFREEQRMVNNENDKKFLEIELRKELKKQYNGDDRRKSNLVFDRIIRILAIIVSVVVLAFLAIRTF